ncbi:60S acidic ribosomal protein P1 [Microtus ochrogaster]|uniref:Large ribosomal subunit protein P1 n=1 Tax=Microtus ochrogaster TaxID=79684 RepID=A0A8J6L8Y9_MICOH|nr:60S acidic ribosomal protein P1 [Microtus ochrogaster]
MAFISELTCIYSTFILHDEEVTVKEDKINARIKAAGVNVEPFWPGLFAKAQRLVGLLQQLERHQQVVLPFPLLLSQLSRRK